MSSLFLIRVEGGPTVEPSPSKRRLSLGTRRLLPRRLWICLAMAASFLAASAGLIVPPIVRQAHKDRCAENLKRLGVAMQNFHEAHGHFPAAAITGKSGTPLLSWRV